MSADANTDWTDSIIARLCALWDEGHSTAEIGRRLGVSKNAVVGKAGRLGLPGRPSPIRLKGSGAPRPTNVPRYAKSTLPTLPSVTLTPAQLAAFGRRPPKAPEATVEQLRLVLSVKKTTGAGCQFPMWPDQERAPRDVTKRFCEAATVEHGVYCREHWRRCHSGGAAELRAEAA